MIPKSRGGASRGNITANESLNVRTGFILDENVSDFFKRHENEGSIFQNKNLNSSRAGNDTTRIFGMNDKPRKHHYGRKSFGDEFDEQKSRFESPENLIDFTGLKTRREKENQESSKFSFKSFWENKLGKLIRNKDDDKRDEENKKIDTNQGL